MEVVDVMDVVLDVVLVVSDSRACSRSHWLSLPTSLPASRPASLPPSLPPCLSATGLSVSLPSLLSRCSVSESPATITMAGHKADSRSHEVYSISLSLSLSLSLSVPLCFTPSLPRSNAYHACCKHSNQLFTSLKGWKATSGTGGSYDFGLLLDLQVPDPNRQS